MVIFALRFDISGFFVRVFTFRFFASVRHCMDTGAQETPDQANDRPSAFGILRKTTKAHVQTHSSRILTCLRLDGSSSILHAGGGWRRLPHACVAFCSCYFDAGTAVSCPQDNENK